MVNNFKDKYYLSLKYHVHMHECIHIYLNLNFPPGTIKNGVTIYNQLKLQRKAPKIPGAPVDYNHLSGIDLCSKTIFFSSNVFKAIFYS